MVGGEVEIVRGILLPSNLLEHAGRQVRGVLCYGVKDSMISPHLVKDSRDGVQGYTVKGLKARRIDNKGEQMFIILIMTGWSVIIIKEKKCL